MRPLALATMLVFVAGIASAQTSPPTSAPTGSPPADTAATAAPAPHPKAPTHHRMTLKQSFDAANTTHDGQLTADQAKAGHMRFVAAHFDEIDTAHQGSVTLDQIHAYLRARHAAAHPAPSTVQN